MPTPRIPPVAIAAPADEDEEDELELSEEVTLALEVELSLAVLVIVITLLLVLLRVLFALFVGFTRVPVAVAFATFGTKYVCTSVGRALNQEGVWPAANSEAISLETAAELVRASAIREEGRAVSRTEMTETLWKSTWSVGCVLLP